MDDSDSDVEAFLDRAGIKVQQTKSTNTFSYDVKSGALVSDFTAPKTANDNELLQKRKSLFREGSLLTVKKEICGFYSYDFKETVADLYLRGATSGLIKTNAILMVLREGIIKTKFDLTSDWSMGLLAKRDVECSFRFIKVLSVNKNNSMSVIQNESDSKPIYFTILVNPEYDTEDLKEFFDFSNASVLQENSFVNESDLTDISREIEDKFEAIKETRFNNLVSETRKQKALRKKT